LGFAGVCAGAFGAGAVVEAAGICITLPHVGQRPFLPAAESGVVTWLLQVEQLNVMGILVRKPSQPEIESA
jgi:hypothetical protein